MGHRGKLSRISEKTVHNGGIMVGNSGDFGGFWRKFVGFFTVNPTVRGRMERVGKRGYSQMLQMVLTTFPRFFHHNPPIPSRLLALALQRGIHSSAGPIAGYCIYRVCTTLDTLLSNRLYSGVLCCSHLVCYTNHIRTSSL